MTTATQILQFLGPDVLALAGNRAALVAGPATLSGPADSHSVVFCNKPGEAGAALVAASQAGIVICLPEHLPEAGEGAAGATEAAAGPQPGGLLVAVANPRLCFARLLQRFFAGERAVGIHPSAHIGEDVQLGAEVFIGPNVVIEGAILGQRCTVKGNVTIYPGTHIGDDVIIEAGCVLGSDGFGYERDPSGTWVKFPHLGGLQIGDGVEIGANSCIDRGTLGPTVIGPGTKIDNLVHIAHNCQIGKNCLIIAHTIIGGSTIIGDDCWLAPNSTLNQGLKIAPGTMVGSAGLVIKDVEEPGTTVFGSPARKLGPSKHAGDYKARA